VIRGHQRQLRDEPNRDPAAVTVLLGLAAHVFDLHALVGIGEIEMHVDIGAGIARDFERAVDLAARIGVEIRRRPDDARTASQRLDH
jgi:hypothetical protein